MTSEQLAEQLLRALNAKRPEHYEEHNKRLGLHALVQLCIHDFNYTVRNPDTLSGSLSALRVIKILETISEKLHSQEEEIRNLKRELEDDCPISDRF